MLKLLEVKLLGYSVHVGFLILLKKVSHFQVCRLFAKWFCLKHKSNDMQMYYTLKYPPIFQFLSYIDIFLQVHDMQIHKTGIITNKLKVDSSDSSSACYNRAFRAVMGRRGQRYKTARVQLVYIYRKFSTKICENFCASLFPLGLHP